MTIIPTSMKPMLASPPKTAARPHDLRGTHAFDLKLDGVRVLAYCDGNGNVTLINRSGRDVTHRFPEVEAALCVRTGLVENAQPVVLDGEVVAKSGSFQDTAMRDKQNKPIDVLTSMKTHPVVYVSFDVLEIGGADIRSQPWQERRRLLEEFMEFVASDYLAMSVCSDDPGFFDQVKAQGMEGVIAKRKLATYRSGRFSDWTKFKAVRSITAIAIGYDKGEGARAHFGAMNLVLLNDSEAVSIGRVGTGMNASEITMLKGELDAGRPVLVEIECLNKSKDGKLRFPVYKGLRTDLSPLDATIAQLDAIPTM